MYAPGDHAVAHCDHDHVQLEWIGNLGSGTGGHRDHGRNSVIHIDDKPPMACSSDRVFHGDGSSHNPADMLVIAITHSIS